MIAIMPTLILTWFLLVFFSLLILPAYAKCSFPAIFNFGDSNSDTGGLFAAFPPQLPPYGETFFHEPAGRASDGRLVIDFLAGALGFPYLSPYLQATGSSFLHGANFASSGSTVRLPNTTLFQSGLSPFFLGVQVSEFKEFRKRALRFFSEGKYLGSLPKPDDFSRSLYTIDIGQNDFTSRLTELTIDQVKSFLPDVVDELGAAVQNLYNEGARIFFIANLAPAGCFPFILTNVAHNNSDLDQNGCLKPYNTLASFYNDLLRAKLADLEVNLAGASVIYLDTNSIKYELLANASAHGFTYTTRACCGGGGPYNYNPSVSCGKSIIVDGKLVTAGSCSNPSIYISWDGVHNTEAANHYIASEILSERFFHPPFPLSSLCDLKQI
eukprot:c53312_g1_i1 orf=170-1318(+)